MLKDGDSVNYIGETRYRKINLKFDTVYYDTVKVFRLSESLFAYEIKFLKYLWLAPLPGEKPTEFSILWIRDSFTLDNNTEFANQITDGDFRSRIEFKFIGEDSLVLNDVEEDTKDNVLERYEFRGVESFVQTQ